MLRQEARMALQATCHRAPDEEKRKANLPTGAVGKALPYLRKRLPSPPAHRDAAAHAARRLVRAWTRAVRSFTTAASSEDS
jgi:hypothetical protein